MNLPLDRVALIGIQRIERQACGAQIVGVAGCHGMFCCLGTGMIGPEVFGADLGQFLKKRQVGWIQHHPPHPVASSHNAYRRQA